jgi:uracil-DNA glycosylase
MRGTLPYAGIAGLNATETLAMLAQRIRACRVCAGQLSHPPRPVVQIGESARLAIIGQAPGRRVHASGIPWNDPSGRQLRRWLAMPMEIFYDVDKVAIVPMGFCYPGHGQNGDLPPRPECAPLWHARLWNLLPNIKLFLLIGSYAQNYYLQQNKKTKLTDTVRNYRRYLPTYFPIPHPSPRNRRWQKLNPWFETDVVPELRRQVEIHLNDQKK